MSRRTALAGALALTAAGAGGAAAQGGAEPAGLAELEAMSGGRLGVCALSLDSGAALAYRADERFPLCSTFKFLAAACVLARVDRGEESLERRVVFARDRLVPYSPGTEPHVGEPGMTMAAICEAAVTLSDNTAGNLMLESFAGPAGLTAFLRSLGDAETRLDRTEPDLNEAIPGDPRDTTTPGAMLSTMRQLVLGEALQPGSRAQLAAWLVANKTGDKRLRAGLPQDWRVGDKTGSGGRGAWNDIAVIWPPDRAPLLVAAYLADTAASDDTRNAVMAGIARLAAGL